MRNKKKQKKKKRKFTEQNGNVLLVFNKEGNETEYANVFITFLPSKVEAESL